MLSEYIFKTLSTSLLIRDAWHLQWLKERRHQEEQQWQSTTKKIRLKNLDLPSTKASTTSKLLYAHKFLKKDFQAW